MAYKETSGSKNYTCYPGRDGRFYYIVSDGSFAYDSDRSYPCENGGRYTFMFNWHNTTSACYGFSVDAGGGYLDQTRMQNNGWNWISGWSRRGNVIVSMYQGTCNELATDGNLVRSQNANVGDCSSVPSTCSQTTTLKVTIPDSYMIVGDSFTPVIETNSPSSVSIQSRNGNMSISNSTVILNRKGTDVLTFSIAETGNFVALSLEFEITISGKSQIITASFSKNPVVNSYAILNVASTSGLTSFTYEVSPNYCTISGNNFTFSRKGIYSITIKQAGNDSYEPATLTISVTVDGLSNSISLSKTNFDLDSYELTPTVLGNKDTAGDITVSIKDSNIGTVTKLSTWPKFTLNTINSVGGTTTLTISLAGGYVYNAISRDFTIVVRKVQTLTLRLLPTGEYVVQSQYTIEAISTSGLTVFTYELSPSYYTLSGNKVTFNRRGNFTIKASQAGNDYYMPASTQIQITVKGLQNSISLPVTVFSIGTTLVQPRVLGDKTTAGDITVSSANQLIAEVANLATWPLFNLVGKSGGNVNLTLSLAGGYTYEPYNATIGVRVKSNQTITITVKDLVVGGTTEVFISSTSGLTNFTLVSNSSDLIVNGRFIIATKVGIYTLTATQAGNDYYMPAEATATVVVSIDNLSPVLILSGGVISLYSVLSLVLILNSWRVFLRNQRDSFVL